MGKDKEASAISFNKETLDALRRIAEREGRSLASLVRFICEEWLRSPQGIAAIKRSQEPKEPPRLGPHALNTAKNEPPTTDEEKERLFSELQEIMARLKKEL
jgi:hypothetical protein